MNAYQKWNDALADLIFSTQGYLQVGVSIPVTSARALID